MCMHSSFITSLQLEKCAVLSGAFTGWYSDASEVYAQCTVGFRFGSGQTTLCNGWPTLKCCSSILPTLIGKSFHWVRGCVGSPSSVRVLVIALIEENQCPQLPSTERRTGCLLLPLAGNKDRNEGFSHWHWGFSVSLFSTTLLWLVLGRWCASNVTCEAFAVVGMSRMHTVEDLSSENQATRPGDEIQVKSTQFKSLLLPISAICTRHIK